MAEVKQAEEAHEIQEKVPNNMVEYLKTRKFWAPFIDFAFAFIVIGMNRLFELDLSSSQETMILGTMALKTLGVVYLDGRYDQMVQQARNLLAPVNTKA